MLLKHSWGLFVEIHGGSECEESIGSLAKKTSKSTATEASVVFFHDVPHGLGKAKIISKLILLWELLRIDVEIIHQQTC